MPKKSSETKEKIPKKLKKAEKILTSQNQELNNGLKIAGEILMQAGETLSKKESNPIFNFTIHHRWWQSKFIEGVSVLPQKFELRIDYKDHLLEILSNDNILEDNGKAFLSESLDRSWENKGKVVEKIVVPLSHDITKLDTSWISLIDTGTAELLESNDNMLEFKLKSGKIDKIISLKRNLESDNIWLFDNGVI